jgi:hypothetical protein
VRESWTRDQRFRTFLPDERTNRTQPNYFRIADDPPAIRKRYGALAELFSYRLLAGRESDRRCVRHADCRQKEGSEADMPRLTVKGRTCRGGLLIDPPGRSLSAMSAPAVVATRAATAPSSRPSQRKMPNPGR